MSVPETKPIPWGTPHKNTGSSLPKALNVGDLYTQALQVVETLSCVYLRDQTLPRVYYLSRLTRGYDEDGDLLGEKILYRTSTRERKNPHRKIVGSFGGFSQD